MNRSERSSSPIASLPELQAETYLESPENLVHLLRPETSTSLFAFLPTRLRREYSAGQSRTSLNPCERMARVLATWGEGRLKTEGNLLSSPVLRNGWVCRVCRQDARRLYSYDNASRRLNRVEEALGSDTSRPSSNPNGFAHGSKIQCSSVMSRESRSPTPRNNNVNNNSSSKRWQPMDRLGVGRGLKAPQRPAFLCAGFSKALASTGPNSRMLNDSFAPESFQDTFMTTKGLSKR